MAEKSQKMTDRQERLLEIKKAKAKMKQLRAAFNADIDNGTLLGSQNFQELLRRRYEVESAEHHYAVLTQVINKNVVGHEYVIRNV